MEELDMKTKTIKTKIWRDSEFTKMSLAEKVLFFYLVTNEQIGLTGIYELGQRYISFETGIDGPDLSRTMESLQDRGKFIFKEDWIYVVNFAKHNQFTPAPNILKSFKTEFEAIPENIRSYFFSKHEYEIPFYDSEKNQAILKDIDIVLDIDMTKTKTKTVGTYTIPPTVPPTVQKDNKDIEVNEDVDPEIVDYGMANNISYKEAEKILHAN